MRRLRVRLPCRLSQRLLRRWWLRCVEAAASRVPADDQIETCDCRASACVDVRIGKPLAVGGAPHRVRRDGQPEWRLARRSVATGRPARRTRLPAVGPGRQIRGAAAARPMGMMASGSVKSRGGAGIAYFLGKIEHRRMIGAVRISRCVATVIQARVFRRSMAACRAIRLSTVRSLIRSLGAVARAAGSQQLLHATAQAMGRSVGAHRGSRSRSGG